MGIKTRSMKLYYQSRRKKPCVCCGRMTDQRARFFNKCIGYPICSAICRREFNPFSRLTHGAYSLMRQWYGISRKMEATNELK